MTGIAWSATAVPSARNFTTGQMIAGTAAVPARCRSIRRRRGWWCASPLGPAIQPGVTALEAFGGADDGRLAIGAPSAMRSSSPIASWGSHGVTKRVLSTYSHRSGGCAGSWPLRRGYADGRGAWSSRPPGHRRPSPFGCAAGDHSSLNLAL